VNPTPAGLLRDLERVAIVRRVMHNMCMKRTNLVLNEQLLEEATRLSGAKTYSAAVMQALEDFVRRAKARQILELRGTGAWEGDLGEMRRDPAPKRKKRAS
jgi:Arc/MetJ family transcription regulator